MKADVVFLQELAAAVAFEIKTGERAQHVRAEEEKIIDDENERASFGLQQFFDPDAVDFVADGNDQVCDHSITEEQARESVCPHRDEQ